MANPTLERLRKQAREHFALALMRRVEGDREGADEANAFAKRCEKAANEIVAEPANHGGPLTGKEGRR